MPSWTPTPSGTTAPWRRSAPNLHKQSQPPGGDPVPDGFVAVARVLGARGLRGDLKIEPLAPVEVLAGLNSVLIDDVQHAIRSVHSRGRTTSVHLDGIVDRETAAALRGALLLVRETDLPAPADGEYYRYQLIGLRVVTASGEPLGEIADIISTPGNDVFVVRGDKGEILIPAIEDVILDIDLTTAVLTIEPIPGLLPE